METARHTDLSSLKEIGGEDKTFMIDLIRTFLKVTPGHLKELEEKSNNGDWVELKHVAHTMKPNVALMGISSLNDIFSNLDGLIPDEVAEFLTQDIITKLKRILNESFKELERDIKDI